MIAFLSILAVGSLISVAFPARGRFGAALILAISAFVLIPADAFEIGTISSIASVIAGLLFLFLAVLTALRPIFVKGTATALMAIVVIGEVSGALSTKPNLFAMVVALVAPAVFLVGSALSIRERSAVLTAVVGLGVIEAILCTYETFIVGGPLLAEVAYGVNPLLDGTIRGQGTLGHPLVAALVMLIGVGCTLVLNLNLVARIPVIILLAFGVLTTGSSSAVVACAFCLVSAFIVIGAAKRRPFKILVVLAVAVAVAQGAITQSIRADIGGANLAHRTNSLIALPRLVTERSLTEAFFGSGWGSGESLYRRNILINDGFYAIDNQFTTIVAVAGIVGGALFVGLLVFIVVKARGPLRVTLLTVLIMSLSFNVLSWVATSSLFWLIAAFALTGRNGFSSKLRRPETMMSGAGSDDEEGLDSKSVPVALARRS